MYAIQNFTQSASNGARHPFPAAPGRALLSIATGCAGKGV